MEIVFLNEADVERSLPTAACVEVMAEALAAHGRGEVYQPLREVHRPPGAPGVVALMPAYRGGERPLFGLKTICVFPGNVERGMDAHQGAVLLFDGATGVLLAVVDGSAITSVRTAAVTAVATRVLARDGAREVAILGAGVQARSHLAALACVLDVVRVRVASRSLASAGSFVEREAPRYAFPVVAEASAEAAVRGADVVVAATSSRDPVLRREWLTAGAHVNLVGACFPTTREADTATIATSSLFVDSRESAFAESGDVLVAMRETGFGPEIVRAELGEVLAGRAPGRTSADEITVFKSLGLAIEDLAAAEYAYRAALRDGVGTRSSTTR